MSPSRRFTGKLLLACSLSLLTGWALAEAQTRHDGPHRPSVACLEDMPCWDCHTDGNRICGDR